MVADITYDDDDLNATIHVEQASHEEIEECLVHELVHLELEAWHPPTDPAEEEETIETIARALLRSWDLK